MEDVYVEYQVKQCQLDIGVKIVVSEKRLFIQGRTQFLQNPDFVHLIVVEQYNRKSVNNRKHCSLPRIGENK